MVGITSIGIVSFIYLLFLGVQISHFFFYNKETLREGFRYSEYARQGFWELIFVSCINFLIVFFWFQLFEKNKILTGLLSFVSICTFFMILSAGYRMNLYIKEYHLTFLRITVLWFLVVLFFFLFGLLIKIQKNQFKFFRYSVIVVSTLYILFSFSKPDEWSAKYLLKQENVIKEEDISYFINRPSIDAARVLSDIDFKNYPEEYEKEMIVSYFLFLEEKENHLDWRSFNLARHQGIQAAKKFLKENAN